jgi:hypothetical protein
MRYLVRRTGPISTAGQKARHREGERRAAERHLQDRLDEQGERERKDEAEQRLLAVEMPDQHPFDDHPERAGDERRRQRRPPAELAAEDERQIGADREEGPMGEVHDAEHAEDDRQPDRDQHV